MNLKKRLRHLAFLSGKDRRLGRTTMLAKACKDLDGIILADNHATAKMIERVHGVTARSTEMNLDGFNGPFIYDHHAVDRLFERAADKIENLEKQLEKANNKLLQIGRILGETSQSDEEWLEKFLP